MDAVPGLVSITTSREEGGIAIEDGEPELLQGWNEHMMRSEVRELKILGTD